MFKKLLNVGKGHSHDRLSQQQQQQKDLFELNEIRSYGFSNLNCLCYSPSLSLLAVGSKNGLLRVLGNPSIEFSHQLGLDNSIRQIEFIDCRTESSNASNNSKRRNANATDTSLDQQQKLTSASAKLVTLTDNGQLHLFELKTVKQQHFTNNTSQTDTHLANNACCQQNGANNQQEPQQSIQGKNHTSVPEYTKLERVAELNCFIFRAEDEDRSKRVTTFEVSADKQTVFVGTESGNLYKVLLCKFEPVTQQSQTNEHAVSQPETRIVTSESVSGTLKSIDAGEDDKNINNELDEETTAVNLNDEPLIQEALDIVEYETNIATQLHDDIKAKKQGAIESIKKHPSSDSKLLIGYHRGLSIIYDISKSSVEQYFYHNQVLESSCFGGSQTGDVFYTSHNDGSYIKWDTRLGNQTKANENFISQVYGPFPSKPTPKIQACTSLLNDQLEELVIFSGGMPRATYDDKNPVTIVRIEPDGKDTIKMVLDFTSKVLDFVVITRPRGNLGTGAKSTGGKKNKNKQHQQQQQRNQPIAVALAILAEEEFVVIDLLNNEQYLEFPLPYLNCIHSSAITCNRHYSDIGDELYDKLLTYNKQQLKGKYSANEWPITGGKVIDAPEVKSRDILLTGHEDGSVDIWDVSNLSIRHLLHLSTARFFSTNDDDSTTQIEQEGDENNEQMETAWPPLKRVGRFDPYSDDTRLAIRKISLCPQSGTLITAGTGGQVLVFELKEKPTEISSLESDEVTIVTDQKFTWKGHDKLKVRAGSHKFEPGYKLSAYVQLNPPVAATSIDLRSDWHLFAVGTSYGFLLYDYANKHSVVHRCTLNVQDFAIVSGDAGAGAMSRKKSFRKSLRESFRRLRRGRSQRNQPNPVVNASSTATTGVRTISGGRITTGVRTLNAPSTDNSAAALAAAAHRNLQPAERQVEQKVELSSIVRCITLTSAVIANNASFKPSLWVGTNSGQVLVYVIDLASEQLRGEDSSGTGTRSSEQQTELSSSNNETKTTASLAKEIQLKHRAPIVAIFTSPDPPSQQNTASASAEESAKSSPEKQVSDLMASSSDEKSPPESSVDKSETDETSKRVPSPTQQAVSSKLSPDKKKSNEPIVQPRVLICSEEQFKVFNLPNLKPFCKFKLTANEGLRAKKISITQFLKPAANKQSISAIKSSKSVQSFATQTSAPSSPVPPATNETEAKNVDTLKQSTTGNNNYSIVSCNNNHLTSDQLAESKELLNAKFGTTSKSPSASDKADAIAEQLTTNIEEETGSFEPYMICMSNQGDCAIYSVPDLKRQAQIQVCKREDINGITSAMLTNYGEGYYLRSSSNFLRFSISAHRVLRVLSVV